MKRSTSFTTVKLYANMSLKVPELTADLNGSSVCSKRESGVTQNPAREKEWSYSKSSKRESGVTQNPAREKEWSYSKSSNREREMES